MKKKNPSMQICGAAGTAVAQCVAAHNNHY